MTFPGLLNFCPPKIPPGTPLGSGGSIFFRFESVPYPSEYVCQIWLRSDRRECNAGMTIAKCTKTAASSNVSNHLSRTPAAWCARGAAHHARPYRNLGRRISLRSYTIVDGMWKKNISQQEVFFFEFTYGSYIFFLNCLYLEVCHF